MLNFVNKHKNFIITLIITLVLIIIITIISYLIYVYGYYDRIKENNILENFNSYKFNRVHDDFYLSDKEHLTNRNLKNITDIMFNKKNLEKIYDNYYQETYKYNSKEDFIDSYYYGKKSLTPDNIVYSNKGKTDIFNRRETKSKEYIVTNNKDEKISIGIINNITFNTLEDDIIKLDEDTINCHKKCTLKRIYSGIHNLEYVHEGFTYYTIIKIVENNTTIDINNISTLVAISKELDTSVFSDLATYSNEINVGIYSLNKCNLTSGCPSTEYSYITLNKDGTCTYYTYLDLDKNGDSYTGTYKKENGFLLMEFNSHTFTILDSETNESKDIETNSNIKMTFKINNKTSFSNKDLEFTLKA